MAQRFFDTTIVLDLDDQLHEIGIDGACIACGEWPCFAECGYVGREIDPETGFCPDCSYGAS